MNRTLYAFAAIELTTNDDGSKGEEPFRKQSAFQISCPFAVGAECSVKVVDLSELLSGALTESTFNVWPAFKVTTIVGSMVTIVRPDVGTTVVVDLSAQKFRYAQDSINSMTGRKYHVRGEVDCPPEEAKSTL